MFCTKVPWVAFSSYILALKFFGAKILVQKAGVKCSGNLTEASALKKVSFVFFNYFLPQAY